MQLYTCNIVNNVVFPMASRICFSILDKILHLFSLHVVVRKWLARKHLNSMQQKKKPRNEKKQPRRKSTRRVSEDKVVFFPDLCVSELTAAETCYLSCLGPSFRAVSGPTLCSC